MKLKLMEATCEFNVDGIQVKFKVIHNLPEIKGMSFMDAFNSCLYRTKTYTSISLCNYIKKKDDSFIAMTESQYKRLML